MKSIDINYRSAEKFFQDYLQLKAGKLFLPADEPRPIKTQLVLNITVPRIDYAFQLNGIVLKIRDKKTAAKYEKKPGMLVHIQGKQDEFFQKLDQQLLVDEKYQFLLALCETLKDPNCIIGEDIDEAAAETDDASPDGINAAGSQGSGRSGKDGSSANGSKVELSFEWLREAIEQEEAFIEEEVEPVMEAPPTQDKKNLTAAERDRVKPAADFIMDLTKAMLRTGYYSPDHPGAQKAKKGLYAQFLNSLGESPEIMITNLETPKKKDILITGILDEPVSVRTLVGSGMAELFVPKLTEFFNRKGLISFALKKQLPSPHFECYIDIMSDPKADSGSDHKMGELLTRALARNGIKEISTVFMDDIIVLEKNLPWRVEMAIQRLAKDLKIMPMFKEKSDEAILKLKIKIIRDIIRPLKYGEYLSELLINCYIIAEHVDQIESEDIEEIIISGIPARLLLSTSQHVFKELKELAALESKESSSGAFQKRHQSVKRIIKLLSRRMIQYKVIGAQRFLEELHHSNVLTFSELPPDVQFLVNTMKIVRDVKSRTSVYIGWVFKRLNPEDAVVMLKCFRRVIPAVVEEKDWDIAFKLTLAVNKVKNETSLYSPENNLPSNPFYFVFKDVSEMLSNAYLDEPTASRLKIDQIVRRLGTKGVDILNLILSKSENTDVRTDAMETIVSMGEVARRWSLQVIDNKRAESEELKNAVAILREVGLAQKDTDAVKKLVGYSEPRVQEEVLHTLMYFDADGLESIIIDAMSNADDKLRWRAFAALGKIPRLSKEAVVKILKMVTSDPPQDEQDAKVHTRTVAQLIQTLGAIDNFPAMAHLEEAILKASQKSVGSGKRFMKRLKLNNPKADQSAILIAAFATLGKIGSQKSSDFLTKFAKGKSSVAIEAQKALKHIESRHLKSAAVNAAS